MDTIFALASAVGKAGVAVVRLSGEQAFAAAEALCGGGLAERGMRLRSLRGGDGAVLDQGLVLSFPGPSSFTGEDVVEFQLHGSPAIVSAALELLGRMPGLRLAEPGEFTRRALENGRMDLAQVEGLADLLDAETEAQRRQAQRIFGGAFGEVVTRWRRDLTRAAALLEAVMDFADEDVPTDVTPEVRALLQGVKTDLLRETGGVAMAERIRSGFEVAIVGPPNVGKSTLLNALAGRKAAITSEHAGTTRDVIEVRMDLRGLPVILLDTAGLREPGDVVEGLGIALARERAASADLRVFLVEEAEEAEFDVRPDDIVLRPKADLRPDRANAISGATGQGIDALIERIGAILSGRAAEAGLATRQRHADAMRRAAQGLTDAELLLETGPDRYDMVAEELRTAIRALEAVLGRVDVEALLDEIFSSFCLGK